MELTNCQGAVRLAQSLGLYCYDHLYSDEWQPFGNMWCCATRQKNAMYGNAYGCYIVVNLILSDCREEVSLQYLYYRSSSITAIATIAVAYKCKGYSTLLYILGSQYLPEYTIISLVGNKSTELDIIQVILFGDGPLKLN